MGCGCNNPGQKASKLFKDCGCGCKGKKQEHKFVISIMSALIFFVVANPETFQVMRRLVGGWVSSPTGCPTIKGLMLHTVVFMLVVWGLMNIRKEGMETPPKEEKDVPPPPEGAEDVAPPPGGAEENPVARPDPGMAPPGGPPTGGPPTGGPPMEPTPAVDPVDVDSDDEMEPGPSPANMGPPPKGQSKMSEVAEMEMTGDDSLAPYAPLDASDPSPEAMAAKTMSQKLGGPVPTTQPQDAMKMGNYMQCKCGDGSHVMLMK